MEAADAGEAVEEEVDEAEVVEEEETLAAAAEDPALPVRQRRQTNQ